jgi:hypothetical protein
MHVVDPPVMIVDCAQYIAAGEGQRAGIQQERNIS